MLHVASKGWRARQQKIVRGMRLSKETLTCNGYAILGTRPGFVRIVIFGVTALVALDLQAGAVDRDIDERAAGAAALPEDNPKFFIFGTKGAMAGLLVASTNPNSHLADSLSASPNIWAYNRDCLDNTWPTSRSLSWQSSSLSFISA
jgi:hypothetical protein